MSPNAPRSAELEAILQSQFEGAPVHHLQAYPSPRDLPTALASGIAHVVFLDVASEPGQALELLSEMSRMGPNVNVIALLEGNDPDLILRCLRSGAVEFLIHPFTAEQLETAMSKLARVQAGAEVHQTRDPAKIYASMPAKGACGATTLAANLAFHMKKTGVQRVLLADMDTLASTLSFVLKIKSSYSFMDALQRASELDHDLWNAMVTESNGVDVLLAPDLTLDNAHELTDPSPVLDYARQVYDAVVIDCGGVYGEWNLNIARAANDLLLISTNELPALQAAQRALSYLDSHRIGRWKIRLVVNRYLRDVGLSREVIGTALHTEVFETLPSDYDAVQKALLDGKPVLTSTVLGKAIGQLTERLSGPPKATSKKGSSLGGLLNLFSKTSK